MHGFNLNYLSCLHTYIAVDKGFAMGGSSRNVCLNTLIELEAYLMVNAVSKHPIDCHSPTVVIGYNNIIITKPQIMGWVALRNHITPQMLTFW